MKKQFRVRVDLGSDGCVDLTTEGNVGEALRAAYDECKKRKQNPIAVTVQQVVDSGKWIAAVPSRS